MEESSPMVHLPAMPPPLQVAMSTDQAKALLALLDQVQVKPDMESLPTYINLVNARQALVFALSEPKETL